MVAKWHVNGLGEGLDFSTDLIDAIDDNARGYATGPERRLMAAVLYDGIQNFLTYFSARGAEGRRKFKEAHAWLHTAAGGDYVFSFPNVCECLGINPDYLRLGIINLVNSKAMMPALVRERAS